MLVIVVIGSGIMAERLFGGNAGLTLLANAIATGCGLLVLITIFSPLSGAHLNPVVSASFLLAGDMKVRETSLYVGVQIVAAIFGACIANLLFGLPAVQAATHVRAGWDLLASEALATFGLILTIWLAAPRHADRVPTLLAVYITAGYWFTPSTSFANPAVTLARSLTDTFTGIRPQDVMGFIGAQLVGAAAATYVARWLHPKAR